MPKAALGQLAAIVADELLDGVLGRAQGQLLSPDQDLGGAGALDDVMKDVQRAALAEKDVGDVAVFFNARVGDGSPRRRGRGQDNLFTVSCNIGPGCEQGITYSQSKCCQKS